MSSCMFHYYNINVLLSHCVQSAVEELVAKLPVVVQSFSDSPDKIHEFAFHCLNEACTTVTHTASKTAVQLVFGKANLVSCCDRLVVVLLSFVFPLC